MGTAVAGRQYSLALTVHLLCDQYCFCLLLTVSATAGVGLRYDRDAREAGKGTFGLGSRGWLLTSERIWWEVFEVLTPEVD